MVQVDIPTEIYGNNGNSGNSGTSGTNGVVETTEIVVHSGKQR